MSDDCFTPGYAKANLTGGLTWSFITLFRTVDDTVYIVEFEIGSEIRGGIGRLVRLA